MVYVKFLVLSYICLWSLSFSKTLFNIHENHGSIIENTFWNKSRGKYDTDKQVEQGTISIKSKNLEDESEETIMDVIDDLKKSPSTSTLVNDTYRPENAKINIDDKVWEIYQ